MKKINEIFHSLQGEGHHTGASSVFVRFSGCNLRCPFCDTRHESGRLMTDEEIIREIGRYDSELVILTGGEPSLWIDAEFVKALKNAFPLRKLAIETNGTRILPEGIDWVTVSPKAGGKVVVTHADEIKVVDCGQPLDPYFALPCRSRETLMYLQPCYVNNPHEREANLRRTISRVLADPRWRLSLQTHRLLDIQ